MPEPQSGGLVWSEVLFATCVLARVRHRGAVSEATPAESVAVSVSEPTGKERTPGPGGTE